MRLNQQMAASILLTIVTVAGAFGADGGTEKSLRERLFAATDARDGENSAFAEALQGGQYDSLILLGQVGGEACQRLMPYLDSADENVRRAAEVGAGFCYDTSFDDALASAAARDADPSAALRAMGFSGGPASRAVLIDHINAAVVTGEACRADDTRAAALFGLMQSVVYDRLDPSALPGLDVGHVLALTADPCVGYAAAYLLGRLQKLEDHLQRGDVSAALDRAPGADIKVGLVRVLRQFGNAASGELVKLADGDEGSVALESLRALGYLSDDASLAFLQQAATGGNVVRRHLALTALGARGGDDALVTATLQHAIADDSPWVAVTALHGLTARQPGKTQKIAEAWLAGDDYYKAFSALGLLADTEDGKQVLRDYAAAHPGTIRGREAAIALDPSIEAVEMPRATPSWKTVQAYQKRELMLTTTQGTICIAPSATAPFASANFMLMADVGKMNGMLWHRVIPGFVAQAGQREDPELASWGTIREEWQGSDHRVGSVGVATAGRDTGSTQFFINTGYNLHLNGRYTVFGQVTIGLDAALALREGDVIIAAETTRAGRCGQ